MTPAIVTSLIGLGLVLAAAFMTDLRLGIAICGLFGLLFGLLAEFEDKT
jgi:hydrogenase/urease accessory protein HupE